MTDGPPPRLPLDRIAAALRRERTRAGLSLSELARRAGIALQLEPPGVDPPALGDRVFQLGMATPRQCMQSLHVE